jgi:hypothetical protein
MKAWNPNWKTLPPVEPWSGPAPPPRDLSPEEKAHNLRQYERTHLKAVLEHKEATQEAP